MMNKINKLLGRQIEKEVKLSLLTDDIIVYGENPKEFTKSYQNWPVSLTSLLDTKSTYIDQFYVYIQSGKWNLKKKTILPLVVSKTMKYLEINL